MDGVAVAARFRLRNKPDRRSVESGSLCIGRFIARPDDNRDLFHSGRERLLDEN